MKKDKKSFDELLPWYLYPRSSPSSSAMSARQVLRYSFLWRWLKLKRYKVVTFYIIYLFSFISITFIGIFKTKNIITYWNELLPCCVSNGSYYEWSSTSLAAGAGAVVTVVDLVVVSMSLAFSWSGEGTYYWNCIPESKSKISNESVTRHSVFVNL